MNSEVLIPLFQFLPLKDSFKWWNFGSLCFLLSSTGKFPISIKACNKLFRIFRWYEENFYVLTKVEIIYVKLQGMFNKFYFITLVLWLLSMNFTLTCPGVFQTLYYYFDHTVKTSTLNFIYLLLLQVFVECTKIFYKLILYIKIE